MQKKTVILATTLLCISMAYFALDVVIELIDHLNESAWYSRSELIHLVFELAAVGGLSFGVFLSMSYTKLLQKKASQDMKTIQAFTGQFDEITHRQFEKWGLTDAERDVAQFTLKGLSWAEIADLRQTSVGTVKAQTNAIFNKSNLRSRTDFLGFFLEEFLDVHTPTSAS